jgi:membrane-bound serine protease (ClpP class)
LEVEIPIEGMVDVTAPSIGQFIVGLDGSTLEVRGEAVTLKTARVEIEDGIEVVRPGADVRFHKPGLVTRFLRITIRPEAAFLFLVLGLAFVVFEFYAAGPGVAAVVGAVALFLSGYGLATLPTWWPAAAATVAGIVLYTVDFQRNTLGLSSLAGTGLLLFGGLTLIDAAPQITISWWPVVLVVAGTALFFGFGLTTVARARFSTPTIGREHLLGRTGSAETSLDPEGIVVVDGARWRARTRRAAPIGPGEVVAVRGVDGVVLEVEPREPRSSAN